VDTTDGEPRARAKAYDGTDFVITKSRWRHSIDRHPELERLLDAVVLVVTSPGEAYIDPRGTIHLLRVLKDAPSDFLVVVVRREASKTYLANEGVFGETKKPHVLQL